MSVSQLVDADGEVTGVSVIARDVTAQLAAERELRARLRPPKQVNAQRRSSWR
ncbi:MAG: hypothetical protein U0075_20785 [Thermomicrobiales bacterium]